MDNNGSDDTRLSLLKARLKLAEGFSKKPHDAWKNWLSEYNIEDFKDTDEIRDKVRIGYIFRKIEADQPAIFDDQPQIFIRGRKADVKDIEPLIDGTYDFLWDIQDLEEKIEDVGVYFSLLGMGFIESPWVTKTKKVKQAIQTPLLDPNGQPVIDPATGQPQMQMVMQDFDVPVIDNPLAEASDPFKLHFSPETKFGPRMDYENCPYYFKKHTWTPEKVKAMFDKDVDTTETLKVEDSDDEIQDDTTLLGKKDLKRVSVYEYYGCLPEENAQDIKDKDGNKVEWAYDKDYHIFFTKNEELKVEECPYDTKPLFVIGNYGLANKFWKFGDAKHLMPLVQELQMYRSQVLEHTRKMANPKPLIPSTTMLDANKFNDPRVGRPVVYQGQVPPSYLSPAPLGREVQVGVDMVRQDLEKTAGGFDLTVGAGQSTVKTPRGIQVYSEAADKNIARKRKKISRLIRQLIIFQFEQIAQNWKPEDAKTINIIDPDGGPQSVQVTSEVLQVLGGVNIMYNLDIEVESLSVNKVQIKQDALNLWELASAHPDIFNLTELAKDLLQNGFGKKDADRFMLSEQDKQAMASNKPTPSVSLSIRADAATPQGLQLLENEGLIEQGQAQQIMASQQAVAQINSQPLIDQANQQPQQVNQINQVQPIQ